LAKFREPLPDVGIGKRIHDRGIELAHNVSWRTLGRKKSEPPENLQSRQSALVYDRNLRCDREAHLCRGDKGFDGAGTHQW
jgi:hypothetical protein